MSESNVILVATDDDSIFAEVDAALGDPGTELVQVRAGRQLRSTVAAREPALVVCDLQIGAMGGFAATLDLRLEAGAGRLEPVPVLLLLDREADRFLAERSGAEDWLFKPFAANELRRRATALIGNRTVSGTA